MLEINNITVCASSKTILDKFSLNANPGEIHVLMGPNGTGKSTLCKVLMCHPDYELKSGEIIYNGHNYHDLNPTTISHMGLFLLSQNPTEIEGITNAELIRNALGAKTETKVDIFKLNKRLNEVCNLLNIPKSFIHRDVNFNMSGGEKKKNELLHLFMLEPEFIILDEIDSGLDIDALKQVGESLAKYYEIYHPTMLIVTHHADILKYFDDYQVHILKQGHIIKSGSKELLATIEKDGFEANVIDES